MNALRTDLAVIVVWTAEVGTVNIYVLGHVPHS